MRTPSLDLTEEEKKLLEQIKFRSNSLDEIRQSLAPMKLLTDLLLEKKAIPKVRLWYFKDPQYNPSGRGKSRLQVFEKNGTPEEEISSHPHFMKYLEYFIFGPNIPIHVERDFLATVGSSGNISLRDIQDFGPKARAFVRSEGVSAHETAEEFFKLAIEHGASPTLAASLRSTVLSVR
jgi:hypothetical protein